MALASALAAQEPGRSLELLADAQALTERATSDLRGQTLSLHQPPEDKALAVALQGDCREFAARAGVAAELVVLGDLPLLDSARTDVLRRTALEALLNVEKHAAARYVVVSLYRDGDGVGLTVADDGTDGTDGNVPATLRSAGAGSACESRPSGSNGWVARYRRQPTKRAAEPFELGFRLLEHSGLLSLDHRVQPVACVQVGQ